MTTRDRIILPTTARDLVRVHDRLTDDQFRQAIDGLDWHERDLLVPCRVCKAGEGEECVDDDGNALVLASTGQKIVHFGRRVKRLLAGIR